MDYGSGAIFGCSHIKETSIAKKYDLPIIRVVSDKINDKKDLLKLILVLVTINLVFLMV